MTPKKEEAATPVRRPRQQSGTYPTRHAFDAEAYGGRWHHSENHVAKYIQSQLKKVLAEECGGVQKRLLEMLEWPSSQKGLLSDILNGQRSPDLKALWGKFGFLGEPADIIQRTEFDIEMRERYIEGSAARLVGWGSARKYAQNSGVRNEELERWDRCLLAINSKAPEDLLTKPRRSRRANTARIIRRLNKKIPRLSLNELRHAVGRVFPMGPELAFFTSEELARCVSRATKIHLVEELPAPWVHDPLNFNVYVRDTGDVGLNEHRSCEALFAYALASVEHLRLSHECDAAVWRLLESPRHEEHRKLRTIVYGRCPLLRRPY